MYTFPEAWSITSIFALVPVALACWLVWLLTLWVMSVCIRVNQTNVKPTIAMVMRRSRIIAITGVMPFISVTL